MRRLALPFAAMIVTALHAQTPNFDVLLTGARIVDGTGASWFRGDIGIQGDTIAKIAPSIGLGGATARRTIDVGGRVVAPGFIDIHTHARRGITEVPTADNYTRQGVTTVIEGPDGSSPLPLAPFLAGLATLGTSVNIGAFVGQGSVCSAVMGDVDRKATPHEIEQMKALVETAMRDDAAKVLDSIRETIAIGEGGGLPTHVSHAKVVGTANFGKSVDMLTLIDEARARGVDVTLDQYPYTASSTSVASARLPAWALEGTSAQRLARLNDPAQRARIKADAIAMIRDERGGGDAKNVQFASCGFDPALAGKTLADLTRQRGLEPTIPNAAETTMWLVEQGGCQGIFHAMNEADLVRILKHPVLGRYVREQHVLTLEDAVRKMTSFPAARLGLTDRGVLRPGMKADIAIFDPATVKDTATFTAPHQYAEGFFAVLVNGQVVFEKGAMTPARPGQILHGRGKR